MSIHLVTQVASEIIASDYAKAAPPITVSALTLFGFPISDIGIALTIVYTLLLIFLTMRDRIWRDKNGIKGDQA